MVWHAPDRSTHVIEATAGYHQGCVWGTANHASSTYPFIGALLAKEMSLLGFAFADNNAIVGPLDKGWEMTDRIRQLLKALGQDLNPRECLLWVPDWAHLPSPPPALAEVQARFPDTHLTYCRRGIPILGLPLGTPEFIAEGLESVRLKVAGALPLIAKMPDGRIYTQLMRECMNRCLGYHIRCFPPEFTDVVADKFDNNIADALAHYLIFPTSQHPSVIQQRSNAVAQLRAPMAMGGFGFTPVGAVTHAAFYNSFCTSFRWIIEHLPTVAAPWRDIEPGPSAGHFFLRGFAQCRSALIQAGGIASESVQQGAIVPEGAVVLPSWSDLADGIIIPEQRALTRCFRDSSTRWSRTSYSDSRRETQDLARLEHLQPQRFAPVAASPQPTESPMHHLLKGDKTVLSHSPLSFLFVVASSRVYDRFPRLQFVVWARLVLGLQHEPLFPTDPAECRCSPPVPFIFDAHGHHRMMCKQHHGGAPKAGHEFVVQSIADVTRACGLACSGESRYVPSLPNNARSKGDLIFHKQVGTFHNIVADFTVTHPFVGGYTGQAIYGDLKDQSEDRYRAKRRKYDAAYTSLHSLFVPLVATTYGVLHPEFLRLLWALSDVTLEPTSSAPLHIGEVRHGKPGRALTRSGLFAKLRARVSSGIAFASAGRMLGLGVPVPRALPRVFPSDCVFCVSSGDCYAPPPPVSVCGLARH
jgi:hypothetical protein